MVEHSDTYRGAASHPNSVESWGNVLHYVLSRSTMLPNPVGGMMDDTARAHLAEAMRQHRKRLRLSWGEVARRSGMTRQNLLRIRKNEIAISDLSATGIEQALGWPEGAVDEILSGRPIPETNHRGYPSDLYSREIRDPIEEAMMAIRGETENVRWSYVFDRREQKYDEQGKQFGEDRHTA